MREEGCLEIIATAATHGLLPLLAAVAGSGARADFDRVRRLPRDVRRRARRILAPGVCLRAGPGKDPAGGQPALVHPRFARPHVRRTASATRDLRSLLHRGRPGRVCARSRFEPAGLERDRRLSGRPGLPRLLSRHRFRSSSRILATRSRRHLRAQVYRAEISPDHGTRLRERSSTTRAEPGAPRRRTRPISSRQGDSK